MRIRFFAVLVMVSAGTAMFSCGRKNPDNKELVTDIKDTNREEMFIWVENARLREKPDLNAGVIAELKGGDKVSLTGETSADKIKVNLRGVDMEDVWVKVSTASGQEGWMFKGMLTGDETRAAAMNDFIIVPGEGVGYIKIGSTQQENERIFGQEFVTAGDIFFAEGMTSPGFYIFKNSPLEVQCLIDKNKKVSQLFLRNPNATWHTADFIKNGMTLDELVTMNGKPVSFSGFGWDYGGVITDFNGGKLGKYDLQMGMSLGEPDKLDGLDEFMGDRDCSTANKKILGKGIKVVEIIIFNDSPAM